MLLYECEKCCHVCLCKYTNSLSVLFVLVDPLNVLICQVPLAVGQEPLELWSVGQLGQFLLKPGRESRSDHLVRKKQRFIPTLKTSTKTIRLSAPYANAL